MGHYFLKIISDFSVNSVLPLQHEDQDLHERKREDETKAEAF